MEKQYSNLKKPYEESSLTENIVTRLATNAVKAVNGEELVSENEMREIMALQEQIADVFVANKTDMATSYLVLAAMADSVYAYMLLGDKAKHI